DGCRLERYEYRDDDWRGYGRRNFGHAHISIEGSTNISIIGGGSVSTGGDAEIFGDTFFNNDSSVVTVGASTGEASWTISGNLEIGDFGQNAVLNINTGGTVTAAALDGDGFDDVTGVYFNGGTLRITADDSAINAIHLQAAGGAIDVAAGK